MGSILGLGSSSDPGNLQPTPLFLPGEFHGQRSLAGYSPWGQKNWTWQRLILSLSTCYLFCLFYWLLAVSPSANKQGSSMTVTFSHCLVQNRLRTNICEMNEWKSKEHLVTCKNVSLWNSLVRRKRPCIFNLFEVSQESKNHIWQLSNWNPHFLSCVRAETALVYGSGFPRVLPQKKPRLKWSF